MLFNADTGCVRVLQVWTEPEQRKCCTGRVWVQYFHGCMQGTVASTSMADALTTAGDPQAAAPQSAGDATGTMADEDAPRASKPKKYKWVWAEARTDLILYQYSCLCGP